MNSQVSGQCLYTIVTQANRTRQKRWVCMNTYITHEHEALPSPGLHAVFHIPCMDTLK